MAGFVNDADFDWTTGDDTGAAPPAGNPMDFVIPDFEASTDVEQAEQEAADNTFQAPPPGTYTFDITGFLRYPDKVKKTDYVLGKSEDYEVFKVTMKLAVAGRRNLTMLETFFLPTGNPHDLRCFRNAAKAADSTNTGFMYRKLEQFLKRLGYPVVVGQPIPKEALAIGQWVGKQVIATVEPGRVDKNPVVKIDAATGMPIPPRPPSPSIKPMSYREAESTLARQAGTQGGAPGNPAPAGPSRPPVGAHAEAFKRAGLQNV